MSSSSGSRRWLGPDLLPELVVVLREGYSLSGFTRDALAGLVVGIVALPLAIAFAIASGVRPEQGLYTAVVAGFMISAFGGSRVQIGGPTGAFVVIVAGVVAEFGYEGLAVATLMAGALLVVMALARLGAVIRFIPYPVTVGFTAGIAVIIALGQLPDALGLTTESLPTHLVPRLAAYAEALPTLRMDATILTLLTIALIQLWPRAGTPVPGPLVALLGTTALAHGLGLEVETIGGRFGSVAAGIPSFRLPAIEWAVLPDLVQPAIAIALLAAIESLLSALVADGLTGDRHRSNAELLGQGLANIASPLFGGIPATGAIARTATNVKNGGRTPVAGIVHATTLLAIVLAAGQWASLIPMATLSGVLLVVAYNMSEWHVFGRLLRGPRGDVLVLLTTFGLTVGVDLVVALEAGVVLAALLLMRRMAEVTEVRPLRAVLEYEDAVPLSTPPEEIPSGVEVFAVNGSFCFGAVQQFTETVLTTGTSPRVVILRMRHVLAMDATGLNALEEVAHRLARAGASLMLSGVRAQPLQVLERSGAVDRIGRHNLFPTLADAVAAARSRIAAKVSPSTQG